MWGAKLKTRVSLKNKKLELRLAEHIAEAFSRVEMHDLRVERAQVLKRRRRGVLLIRAWPDAEFYESFEQSRVDTSEEVKDGRFAELEVRLCAVPGCGPVALNGRHYGKRCPEAIEWENMELVQRIMER